jgi:hypothetical protein
LGLPVDDAYRYGKKAEWIGGIQKECFQKQYEIPLDQPAIADKRWLQNDIKTQ